MFILVFEIMVQLFYSLLLPALFFLFGNKSRQILLKNLEEHDIKIETTLPILNIFLSNYQINLLVYACLPFVLNALSKYASPKL